MKTPILLWIAAACVLLACNKNSDTQPPVKKPVVEIDNPLKTEGISVSAKRFVELNPNLSNIEEFKQTLNQYQVILEFPPAMAKEVSITRVNTRSGETDVIDSTSPEITGKSILIKDVINLENHFLVTHKYKYVINLANKSYEPIEISLKPDLIVQSNLRISSLSIMSDVIEVGALVITNDSSFITDGRNVSISADTIVSENGKIESFTEQDSLVASRPGTPGTSGGDLVVNTDFFTGELKIIMRGKKGGKGVDGVEITEKKEKAASGRDSTNRTKCLDYNEYGCTQYTCVDWPTDGAPGEKGVDGNNGNPGARGGDSGVVTFNAKQATKYRVRYEAIPGAGGDPGIHSKGGTGGEGGDPGKPLFEECDWGASPGARGPDGAPGKDGAPGEPGTKQKSNFTINNQSETGEN